MTIRTAVPALAALAILVTLAGCQPKTAAAPEPSASAAALPDAKAFLAELYSHYQKIGDFSPLDGAAPKYFDPDMLALMDEDAKLRGNEIGALDGDPICDCQDFGKLSADITVNDVSATEAHATVIVTETDPNFGADGMKPRTFHYDLHLVDGAWRIHDLTTPALPSLRELFIASNKELKAYAASQAASSK